MKRRVPSILFALMFLLGFGILVYPTIANQWNTYRQSHLISNYEEVVQEMEKEDFSEYWEAARSFNQNITENKLYEDVFGIETSDMKDTEYWSVLNLTGDGIMGYISVPKINIKLAIYHGTAEDVLQTGVGHLGGTKLPIGDDSSHTVLAAHRGLPSARLFTDVDQLVKGDMIYIHVFDETFAYQVDQILDMIDKDDTEALQDALAVVDGEDKVTLFTCTPYGVNSHRLLVRGTRVAYNGEEEVELSIPENMLKSVQNYYMIYLILGLAVTILVITIMRFVFNKKRK